jgi:hypothetical protein
MLNRFALLACSVVLVGPCHHGPKGLEPVLPIQRVYYDDGGGYRDSVHLVVQDSMMWKQVWRQATSTQASPPPRPEVDFGSEILLVVGAGRMAPGDQIRVDSVGVRQGTFIAVVRITTECRSLAADVYPLEIVRARRPGKPVAFEDRREKGTSCQ